MTDATLQDTAGKRTTHPLREAGKGPIADISNKNLHKPVLLIFALSIDRGVSPVPVKLMINDLILDTK